MATRRVDERPCLGGNRPSSHAIEGSGHLPRAVRHRRGRDEEHQVSDNVGDVVPAMHRAGRDPHRGPRREWVGDEVDRDDAVPFADESEYVEIGSLRAAVVDLPQPVERQHVDRRGPMIDGLVAHVPDRCHESSFHHRPSSRADVSFGAPRSNGEDGNNRKHTRRIPT